MKLRVQGNSIRFRLNRSEVADFAATGHIAAVIPFDGGAAFRYALERSTTVPGLDAQFSGCELRIRVPAVIADDWVRTDVVGMRGEHSLQTGETLQIDVEKDFQCLHKGEAGKDPDAYPNPMAPTAG